MHLVHLVHLVHLDHSLALWAVVAVVVLLFATVFDAQQLRRPFALRCHLLRQPRQIVEIPFEAQLALVALELMQTRLTSAQRVAHALEIYPCAPHLFCPSCPCDPAGPHACRAW